VGSTFFLLTNKRNREVRTNAAHRSAEAAMTSFIASVNLPFLVPLKLHSSSWNSAMPPHSLLFPTTETALEFRNTPSVGTKPSKLLKERFKVANARKSKKKSGMFPVKLLCDRFKTCRPLNEIKDEGIVP
jgi:hypothetical protein